jgi:CubicO group peptidase (beta-lactamase class C family)
MQTCRLALILAASLLPSLARADGDDLAAKLRDFMKARAGSDGFSGTVLVAQDGKVLFREGYGLANRELDVPNAPRTKFRLGSITKQFTAAAVLILQERGKFDVQEKIKQYLPDSPSAWDEVSIHHLLTHTSGIPSYTGLPDYLAKMREPTTPDQLLARFKDRPLEFTPGTKFKYSNSGYAVLGKLIEAVSGQGYADFLRDNIFKPLNMNDSGYDRGAMILKHRASGYGRSLLGITNALFLDMSIPFAAGGLYSTVDDLLLWDQALSSGKILSKKSLEMMFTPFKDNYGCGWIITRQFGRKLITHGGGINGFVTDIRRFPDEKLCVIVLSNVVGTSVNEISRDLAAIALGEPVDAPTQKGAKSDETSKKPGTEGNP